jgi:sulfate adenylyltransferase
MTADAQTPPEQTPPEQTWYPGARALADAELLLLGAYAPLDGFCGPTDAAAVAAEGRLADGTPWPVAPVLPVPDDLADGCPPGTRLVLTDAEGAPVACVDVRERWERVTGDGDVTRAVAGPVSPRGEQERGPFRALRRTAAETRAELAGAATLGVAVDGALQRADVDGVRALAGDDRLLLLPLLDGRPGGLDPARLVRATLAAAADLPHALVVPVPWTRHDDAPPAGTAADAARADAALRAHVLAAYGATRAVVTHPGASGADPGAAVTGPVPVVRPRPPAERLPDGEVAALLGSGSPLPDGAFAPGVARELHAAHPPLHRRGFAVLFTGLSGSGKSTVAHRLAELLAEHSTRTVTALDGDEVRRMLSSGLGFSRADRDMNVRRIGWVAAECARHGGVALAAPIAPYAATRAEVRRMVEAHGAYVLVHVATPLEECERRDRKGLYAKARAGLIAEFTGISDPYEEPDDADLVLDTTHVSPEDAARQVLTLLTTRGLVRLED